MYEKSYHNLNFIRIWPEKTISFDGWSWFKFNNLGLALGMVLKFYTSVAKWLNIKPEGFWKLIPTFVEVTEEKLVRGIIFDHPTAASFFLTFFSSIWKQKCTKLDIDRRLIGFGLCFFSITSYVLIPYLFWYLLNNPFWVNAMSLVNISYMI